MRLGDSGKDPLRALADSVCRQVRAILPDRIPSPIPSARPSGIVPHELKLVLNIDDQFNIIWWCYKIQMRPDADEVVHEQIIRVTTTLTSFWVRLGRLCRYPHVFLLWCYLFLSSVYSTLNQLFCEDLFWRKDRSCCYYQMLEEEIIYW